MKEVEERMWRRREKVDEQTQSDQLHSLVLTLFVKNGETQGKND